MYKSFFFFFSTIFKKTKKKADDNAKSNPSVVLEIPQRKMEELDDTNETRVIAKIEYVVYLYKIR